MKDAREEAVRLLEASQSGLTLTHLHDSVNWRGWICWTPTHVCIGVPYDPMKGEHERTMYILYAGGSVAGLAEVVKGYIAAGFTHACYAWEIKRGIKRERKVDLRRWMRLVKAQKK